MKILFITFRFPPFRSIGAIRTGKTAKILFQKGCDLKVICGEDDLPMDLEIEIPNDKVFIVKYLSFENKILDFLRIKKKKLKDLVKSGKTIGLRNKFLKVFFRIYSYLFYVPDKYFFWFFPAVKKAKEIMKNWKPDIIYASGMPHTSLIVGSYLSKKYKIPFVAELRDLWCDNHYEKRFFVNFLFEYLTLKNAKSIITVSEELRLKLVKRYKVPTYVIMNGFDEEDFQNSPSFKQRKNNDKIIILYTGTLYEGKRDPKQLFMAINKSEYLKSKVICKFYGPHLGWLEEVVRSYDIKKNVEIYEPIYRSKILELQKDADVLLLLTWDDPKEKGVYTGKLFEYIGSSKPILAIGAVDDVAGKLINKYGFGLATNDTLEIESFLKKIAEDQNFLKEIEMAYLKYRSFFERKKQIDNLIKIFETLIYDK